MHEEVLVKAHSDLGHQGRERTYALLRRGVFWSGMLRDEAKHVTRCKHCCITKERQPKLRTPLRHLLAFSPLEVVAIDYFKIDKGKGGFEDVLVITDVYSKFTQAVPCKDQKATTVAKVLQEHCFFKFGIPNRIHSDQGRNFEFLIIAELCKLYGIRKSHTTPYHPQGNAQAERFNRTLFGLIKSLSVQEGTNGQNCCHIWFLYILLPGLPHIH